MPESTMRGRNQSIVSTIIYAFRRFPPFFALTLPVELARSGPDVEAASMSSISALYFWSAASRGAGAIEATLFESSLAIVGTEVASIDWNGGATKWPAASNHSVKERDRLMVRDVEEPLGVILTVTL